MKAIAYFLFFFLFCASCGETSLNEANLQLTLSQSQGPEEPFYDYNLERAAQEARQNQPSYDDQKISVVVSLTAEEKRELTDQAQNIAIALEKKMEGLSQEILDDALGNLKALKDENIQAIERILPETDTIQEVFEVYCDTARKSEFFTRYSVMLPRDTYTILVSNLERYEVLVKLDALLGGINESSRSLLGYIEKGKLKMDFLKNIKGFSVKEPQWSSDELKKELNSMLSHALRALEDPSVVMSFNLNELLGGIQEAIANPAFINGISNELSALKSRIDRQIALIDENLTQQLLRATDIFPR